MSIEYKKRRRVWPFINTWGIISALAILVVGCNRSSIGVPTPATQKTNFTSTPIHTPSVLQTKTQFPIPSPILTEAPTSTPTPSPSPTSGATSLIQWAEWQLKYDGEATWSPDGKHLVITDDNIYGVDDQTQMYDVNTLEPVWRVNVGIPSITFSPDGKIIVSSSRSIEFWDAATGKLIDAPYEGNASLSAAFIPGKNTLLKRRCMNKEGNGIPSGRLLSARTVSSYCQMRFMEPKTGYMSGR